MIFHIANRDALAAAKKTGLYEADSLHTEGFIHTSKAEQVAGVRERYYKGHTGLILLHIDESKLTSPLKYENAPSVNELFPHVYGPINMSSVVKEEELV